MNINKCKEIIAKVIKSGNIKKSFMLHSAPGIGKSAIVKQLAKEHNMELVDIRLSTMDLATFIGVPHVNKNHEFVWGNPEWFNAVVNYAKSKNVILFFDELTNAPQSLQHAAYRTILDRELREFSKLPDNVLIIGAGNRVEDNTGAHPMLPALANRFNMHFHIEPSVDAFIEHYAIKNNLHKDVVGFLMWAPRFGYKPPKTGQLCFPTFRAWESVSEWLEIFSPTFEHIAGIVGESAANEFVTYIKYVKKLPKMENLLAGDFSELDKVDNMGMKIALTVNLSYKAIEDIKNETGLLPNIRAVFDHFDKEKLIVFYKILYIPSVLLPDGHHESIGYIF